MLALVLSDIHDAAENAEKTIKLIHNKGVEVVVICGDLTNFGGRKEAEGVLEKFEGFRVLAIPGNLDTGQVVEVLEEKGMLLHGKCEEIGGFSFCGFGGGLAGHAGSFLLEEKEIRKGLLKACKGRKNVVIVSHLPPLNTKIDLSSSGTHIGSKAVKEAVEEVKPVVLLCGHAHEAFGEEKIGKTECINVGAVKDGRALLLELVKGGKVKWERIQV